MPKTLNPTSIRVSIRSLLHSISQRHRLPLALYLHLDECGERKLNRQRQREGRIGYGLTVDRADHVSGLKTAFLQDPIRANRGKPDADEPSLAKRRPHRR